MSKTVSDTIVKLENVRLSFPALFKAESVNGGDPRFSANFIFAKDSPTADAVKKAINTVAIQKWGDDAGKVLKSLQASNKLFLHDGDTKEYDGYEGNYYVSAGSKTRPLIIDRDRSALSEDDGKPYSGCFVNASISVWAQDNNWGKRINAQLRGVQFAGEGEAFSGGGAASVDEFGEVEGGAESDDLADGEGLL